MITAAVRGGNGTSRPRVNGGAGTAAEKAPWKGAATTTPPNTLHRRAARANAPAGARTKPTQDLLAFRPTFPGTPQAVRAAALLSKLPSAMDGLDPAKIPPLERFDWQPKELVGVLGEHRGRHG